MSQVSTVTGDVPIERRMAEHPLRVRPFKRAMLLTLVGNGLAAIGVISLVGRLYLILLDDGPVGDADRRITQWLADHRTPTWNRLSEIGSMLSESYVKVALVILFGAAFVVIWRRWHDAVFVAFCVAWETTVFVVSSFIVDRDRPPTPKLDSSAPSGSFPSGHAAAAVAFYGSLYVITRWHTTSRRVRASMLTLAIAAPLAVGVSRVQRGMHHPLDVLVGWALGVIAIVVFERALTGSTDHRHNGAR